MVLAHTHTQSRNTDQWHRIASPERMLTLTVAQSTTKEAQRCSEEKTASVSGAGKPGQLPVKE